MKAIQVFQCAHCHYYRKTKKSVEAHEQRCFYNSDSRSCATCIYLCSYHESECMVGVEFPDGKLRTQCAQYMTSPDDPEEALAILEKQGYIKLCPPIG